MSLRTSGDVLKDLRLKKGLSQIEFARLLGYRDRTTITKLESGENSIPASRIAEVAAKLGVSEKYLNNELEKILYTLGTTITYLGNSVLVEDDFDGKQLRFSAKTWERLKEEGDPRPVFDMLREAPGSDSLISDEPQVSDRAIRVGILYDRADARDQKLVDTVLEPYDDGTIPSRPVRPMTSPLHAHVKRREEDGFNELTVYEEPTAAGFGNYLSASPAEHTEQYPEGIIPRGTNYGVPISGDSMEPKFHNGSTAFVQSVPVIDDGEIGLFSLNGNSYIKQLVVDRANGSVRLHSLNPAYQDIEIHEGDYLYTFGRVLGSYPV